jgi:hypothetical protein
MKRLRHLPLTLMLSLCLWIPCLLSSQSKESKDVEYQTGTITEFKQHQPAASDGSTPYDVTVRVGNREYVVLYTSPIGSDRVKYSEGQTLLVKVGSKTLAFRDLLGRYSEWPILSSKEVLQTTQR